ncbi:MAG: aminodeoxychorismate synthase, component I, partial [Sphingomonas sp.]
MLVQTPFVLLDDARPGGSDARLYTAPVRVIVAHRPDEIAPALAALDAARAEGLHAAGYVAYEAGHALEPKLAGLSRSDADAPLLWFGLFGDPAPFDPATLPDPRGAWVGAATPLIDRGTYLRQVAAVQALIAAGDIYQANLT